MKRHLRVDYSDDDALISAMIVAAVGLLDPAAGGTLGRALRPQTWELQLPSFYLDTGNEPYRRFDHDGRRSWRDSHSAIKLPHPPLISIDSVTYDDEAGEAHTLIENTDFRVIGKGGRSSQSIIPAPGKCWPAARWQPDAVRIRYTCGYPAPAAAQGETLAVPETMPQPIHVWLKLQIGAFYENREMFEVAQRESAATLPDFITNMLAPLRGYV
ncbi:head-tail connector protein [Bradyrhizobium elkanii]|uniref:head-tail connector protein n=1 Tax=Bradyrhizobium elkanii TaxID=29448 RepID=UPI0012F6B995|nr:head-tail connector protein [Bradyrhizobium elkanii]MCP1731274.1 hypothetical protein [Bradyrhizobium elkanii]MCS3575403.1 hypothetical protein [Bradyrhizobium elkanii]MCS3591906.1 hypothetical protein [Bradyrhizobium elkanii]MCS3621351.1 hypothetical protein [Bradyrhizobium elkanii]